MLVSLALLAGALIAQEPAPAPLPPDPEHLMRVSVYRSLQFQGAERPFQHQDPVFVPEASLLGPEAYRTLARDHGVIIEVCRPSRTCAAGQWVWPRHDLRERAHQCVTYGTPVERLP